MLDPLVEATKTIAHLCHLSRQQQICAPRAFRIVVQDLVTAKFVGHRVRRLALARLFAVSIRMEYVSPPVYAFLSCELYTNLKP